MSFEQLPQPDDQNKPASWMSTLGSQASLRTTVAEAPRWPSQSELIALVQELFNEGVLDPAQMQVLRGLPELAQSQGDAKPSILPAE